MRIVAGTLRGRRLQGPGAGDLSIRPTSDRAREALFALLQKWPTGAFLDLFGGTGAVAVEAWSRGYSPVVCVERAPAALARIRANAQGTGVRVLDWDLKRLGSGHPGSGLPGSGHPGSGLSGQSVIFADPPYEATPALWPVLAPALAAWLAPDGVLVWETEGQADLPEVPGLVLRDVRRYGAARFHFFTVPEREGPLESPTGGLDGSP